MQQTTNALKKQTFYRTARLVFRSHTHPQKYRMSGRFELNVGSVLDVESGCAGTDVDVVSHDVTQSNPSD